MNNLKYKKFNMALVYKFFSFLIAFIFGLFLIPLEISSAAIRIRRIFRPRLSSIFATSTLTRNHLGVPLTDPCVFPTRLEDEKKQKKTTVKRCLKIVKKAS